MGDELDDTVAGTVDGIGTPARLAERYDLVGLLGTGGMGAVYRARDTVLGEVVALKMLRASAMHEPAALERFRDEVRLARRVTHANVARTFDIGEHEGVTFLTMEWIDGRSLGAIIAERGALPESEVVGTAIAICAALSAAHAASVVHRDLKPENVMIAKNGRVVVTDFGIAFAHGDEVGAKMVVGTPAYMAPEQLASGAVDVRADIYALGAVLFEMTTGSRAWNGESVLSVINRRLQEREPADPRTLRPHLDERLATVTLRCLRHAPADRFASVDDVRRALEAVEPAPPSAAAARSAAAAPRPASSRKKIAVLPFRNDGPAEDAYIADGFTDDLVDTLSMTGGLFVRPRAAVARFRDDVRPLDTIGRELGVDVVVDGSVRRIGAELRVGIRLIGTADGFQLWARRFQGKMADLLVESDVMARAIAMALTTELPTLDRVAPTDPTAVELYLRARTTFYASWQVTAAPAAELFERAVRLAPTDARVVTGAAMAYVRMIFFGEGDRPTTTTRARELTERAVVLAPNFGEAWAALANLRLHTGDPVGAARALRAGVERSPQTALLQELLGRLLLEVNAVDEAAVRLDLAREIDPLFTARLERSRAYALVGDWDRADAMLVDAVAISGADVAIVDMQRARFALWRGAAAADVDPRADTYGAVYVDVLRTRSLTSAQRTFMLERVQRVPGRLRAFFYQRNAEILAFLGELDDALTAVDGAVGADLVDLSWMDRCPTLAPLRTDPRWAPLRAVVQGRAAEIVAALEVRPS